MKLIEQQKSLNTHRNLEVVWFKASEKKCKLKLVSIYTKLKWNIVRLNWWWQKPIKFNKMMRAIYLMPRQKVRRFLIIKVTSSKRKRARDRHRHATCMLTHTHTHRSAKFELREKENKTKKNGKPINWGFYLRSHYLST